ncbi:Uncharacterised protein [Bordetella pertussis]|nr:Uncharacterised protein [Bordetella pertussis]
MTAAMAWMACVTCWPCGPAPPERGKITPTLMGVCCACAAAPRLNASSPAVNSLCIRFMPVS